MAAGRRSSNGLEVSAPILRSITSDSGLVKLPPSDGKDSMLEDTEESEKPEHAVEGRLMLSPWLRMSMGSSRLGSSAIAGAGITCAQGVRGGDLRGEYDRAKPEGSGCRYDALIGVSDTSMVGIGTSLESVVAR
jgi:hypothetical protein